MSDFSSVTQKDLDGSPTRNLSEGRDGDVVWSVALCGERSHAGLRGRSSASDVRYSWASGGAHSVIGSTPVPDTEKIEYRELQSRKTKGVALCDAGWWTVFEGRCSWQFAWECTTVGSANGLIR